MKKILSLIMILALALSAAACGGTATTSNDSLYNIAMVTGYGDINDQSFNQATWEAIEAFAADYSCNTQYFMPSSDDNSARVAAAELAIASGYDIIVLPGYIHGATVVELSETYTDTKFIALDISAGDLLSTAVANKGETYDYIPENWNLSDYVYLDNVYCAVYQEEISGFMAGYAAVKLGYTSLGYLGGMAVPAVQRYGYGYVQGIDAAAKDLGITVDLKYAYANQFYGDSDITAAMDTWYNGGIEVVFSCGASVYTSVAEAAKKVDGKIIGVDVDQAATIDADYGTGMTLSSATKGLAPTTYNTLVDVLVNGNWSNYAGKVETLGLISTTPSENYVQLGENTLFEEGTFSYDDYTALVTAIYNGTLTVSNDTSVEPATTNVNVQWLGNIK